MEEVRKLMVWFLLSVLFGATVARAHPYHESFAELSWNEQYDKLRVAIRTAPEDMEQALSQDEQRMVVLDERLDTDKALLRYFWKNFRIIDSAGKSLPLQWIGKEVGAKEAWFYFEFTVASVQPLKLIDRVLVDWQPTQINRVLILEPQKKKAVHVLRGDSAPLLLSGGQGVEGSGANR